MELYFNAHWEVITTYDFLSVKNNRKNDIEEKWKARGH